MKKLPYDPSTLILGLYIQRILNQYLDDILTPTFTAALFTIAKIRKEPKCILVNE
jgi:hypothetical protein